MRKKVLVPLTRCAEGIEPVPMRWQRRPSLLAYNVSQVALYLGSQLAVFEKFAGGRITNQERQETGPVFQSQRFAEKCKNVNL